MKNKFKIGDLIKHSSEISWRNQSHRGIVVEVRKAECSGIHDVVTVVWANHGPDMAFGTTKFYDNSIELVARVNENKV